MVKVTLDGRRVDAFELSRIRKVVERQQANTLSFNMHTPRSHLSPSRAVANKCHQLVGEENEPESRVYHAINANANVTGTILAACVRITTTIVGTLTMIYLTVLLLYTMHHHLWVTGTA